MILPKQDKHKGNRVLDDLKYIHQKDVFDALGAATRRLAGFAAKAAAEWQPDVPTSRNPAKQLAHELLGRPVVIYSGPKMYPAAEAWKEACNLHARQLAWCARIDRMSELVSWTGQPIEKPFVVVELRSNLEDRQVQDYFAVAERQLSGMRPAPVVVEVEGGTLDEQREWAAVYGEFVAIYLGLLNGFDPSAAALLEKLKKGVKSIMSDNNQAVPQFDPKNFSIEPHVKRIEKPWGYELHWVPADAPYMGKILHINAGARLSLQVHDEKQESWFIMSGKAAVIWEDSSGELIETELQPGVGYSTQVGQKHRLKGITDCDIVEVSTPEKGTTWRLEDDYARPHETPEQRKKERGEAQSRP